MFSDFAYLEKNILTYNKSKYYDLQEMIESGKMVIYHFYAGRNAADNDQADLVKSSSRVRLFRMKEATHGATI